MFGAVAACRAKYRRSAVRAEAPPRGGSQTLAPRTSAREQHSADRSKARELKQRALFLNKANAACGAASPAKAEVTIHRAGRLRLAQHCKLQKTISEKNDCKQRKPTNYKIAKREKLRKTTANEQRFSLNPPRHYAASGLLNLLTTLMRTMIRTTPGVKLPFQR